MRYVPPIKTVITTAEAIDGFRDGWRALFKHEPTPSAVAILAAQSALESGWWKSMWNFNPSNIKPGSNWTGLYTCIRLNERLDGAYVWFSPEGEERHGQILAPRHAVPPGHPQTRMRAFETFAGGVADKLRFLTGGRWLRAIVLASNGDADGYVRELKKQGYFTAELEPYLRAVVQITNKLRPIAEQSLAADGFTIDLTEPTEPELCADMAACSRTEVPDWLRARLELHRVEHIDDAMDQVRRDRDRDVSGG